MRDPQEIIIEKIYCHEAANFKEYRLSYLAPIINGSWQTYYSAFCNIEDLPNLLEYITNKFTLTEELPSDIFNVSFIPDKMKEYLKLKYLI